jgi:hypothetical protein
VPALRDTLANPDRVAADASRDRLDLAKQAKVLGSASTSLTRSARRTTSSG